MTEDNLACKTQDFCKTCKTRPICKVYDFINSCKDTTGLAVVSCKSYVQNQETSPEYIPLSNASFDPVEHALSLEERIQSIKESDMEDAKLKNETIHKDIFPEDTVCEVCGGQVRPFCKCEKCGKILCAECAVEDPISGMTLCDDCQEVSSVFNVERHFKR